DGRKRFRFGEDLFGEPMQQVKLADNDFDVDTKIIFVAENLNYSPARVLGGRRPVGDLDIDDDVLEVCPVSVAGGFGAEDAVGRTRPWSSIVGRRPAASRRSFGRSGTFHVR